MTVEESKTRLIEFGPAEEGSRRIDRKKVRPDIKGYVSGYAYKQSHRLRHLPARQSQ